MDTSSYNIASSCDDTLFSSDSECDDWNTNEYKPHVMVQVPALPPWNSSCVINEYEQYLDGLGVEEKGERLIEMAMSYCYTNELFLFIWGVKEDIHGDFSPDLQQLVNVYNQLHREEESFVSYFGFSKCTNGVYAFCTPDEYGVSIIDLSDEDAKQLSECFARMDYIDINHLL
jgi:hypothetical protein